MTKYAAEQIRDVTVYVGVDTALTETLDLADAQRAAVAVALERPDEVVAWNAGEKHGS